MKNCIKILLAATLLTATLASCNKLEVTLPKGPQGEQGIQGVKGADGLTAYEVWVNAVKNGDVGGWDKSKTEVHDYFLYLKGEQGEKGDKGDGGDAGKSAYDLWKEYVSGGDVDNPQDPGSKWDPSNDSERYFYLFLTGPKGDDGLVPYIGGDGNWWIGDENTGIPATGPKGENGQDGKDGQDGKTPYIGENGSWIIDGEDTGIPATGPKGDDGEDGLSAYELWKAEVLSDEGLDNPGNGAYDPAEHPKWPAEAVSEVDFYIYLHGVKGDQGETGPQGLSAYEVWKEYISSGAVDNPQNPGSKWDPSDDSEADFYLFLTGPKGDDGLIPYIGGNNNWWIGDEDTGKPSRGPKGATGGKGEKGDTPQVGANGNWWISGEDTGIPAKGKDGVNGKDGVDGKDGTDGKDGVDGKDGADGKDGVDGTEGKSAYEIWKADVLSDSGLANPGNGVYDIDEYPTWPKSAVEVSDFWLYLRGKDGVDGKDGQDGQDGQDGHDAQPTAKMEYNEEVDADKYNLAPVRALMKIKTASKAAAADTTYEYVNPYSGGCAFIVTGPGPVIIPNCEVVFKDVSGKTYTKTSDGNGFIYLSREELPEWTAGSKTASTPSKPLSFKFSGKTVSDASMIGETCKVPYRVNLEVEMTTATLDAYYVNATNSLTRIVEGVRESSWGGVDYPFWNESSKCGYKYYRSESAIASYYAAVGSRPSFEDGIANSADALTAANNSSILKDSYNRKGTYSDGESTDYDYFMYGNGANPSQVNVQAAVYTISSSGGKLTISKPDPDYGLEIRTSRQTHIPEIRYIGDLDFTSMRAMTKPRYDDPENEDANVTIPYTYYDVVMGETEFSGAFDLSTFGQCYIEGEGTLEGDTFRFERYSSLDDYRSAYGNSSLQGYVNVVGTHNKTKIDNHSALRNDIWSISDVYDGLEVIFGSSTSSHQATGRMRYGKVSYAGDYAVFNYNEGSFSCYLSGKFCSSTSILTVYDGKTMPL